MSAQDDWLTEHKGPYLDTRGYVWYCDDECGCSQALIVERYKNAKVSGVVRIGTWEGPFHTDHEADAEGDLKAKRAELRESDPDLEARITWPWAE